MTIDLEMLTREKIDKVINLVINDPRWNLNDELLCQVLGFTLYGYAFGCGRLLYFLDVDKINSLVASALTGLGIGARYCTGLVEAAHQEFIHNNKHPIHAQLVGVGHSHFASSDLTVLVNSVYENVNIIRKLK